MSIVNLISGILAPDYAAVYLLGSEILEEASRREGAHFEGMVGRLAAADPEPGNEECSDATFQTGDDGRIFVEINTRNSSLLHGQECVREVPRSGKVFMESEIQTSPATDLYQLPELIVPSYSGHLRSHHLRRILTYPASLLVGILPIMIIGLISHYEKGQSTISQRVWTMTWLVFGIVSGLSWAIYSELSGLALELEWENRFSLVIIAVFNGTAAIGGFFVVGQMLTNYGNCVRLY